MPTKAVVIYFINSSKRSGTKTPAEPGIVSKASRLKEKKLNR